MHFSQRCLTATPLRLPNLQLQTLLPAPRCADQSDSTLLLARWPGIFFEKALTEPTQHVKSCTIVCRFLLPWRACSRAVATVAQCRAEQHTKRRPSSDRGGQRSHTLFATRITAASLSWTLVDHRGDPQRATPKPKQFSRYLLTWNTSTVSATLSYMRWYIYVSFVKGRAPI